MKIRRLAVWALSVAIMLVLWAMIASFFPPTLLPGPAVVGVRLAELMGTGDFWLHLSVTVQRVVAGFVLAFVVSVAAGTLMGAWRLAEGVFEPWVLVGLTIPGLCWVVLAVMWFGITEMTPVFAIFVVVLPMLTLNMWQGTKGLDRDLIEMARVFRAPWSSVARDVVLPQLLPLCLAGVRMGFALGWKVVVLSEMFGLSSGVGSMINRSFSASSMDDVLAWTVGFTLVMFVFEYAVMLPVERRLVRWRQVVRV